MQNAALRACEIDMQYARFHIRANELRSALRFLRDLDFIGINLTVPHKIAAFTQVDEAEESASRAGAINTIRVRDKKLIGSNTDGEGFLRAVRERILGRCARSASNAYRRWRRHRPGDRLAMRARELRTPGPRQSHS